MESSETLIRVLVVAHKTAATQPLLDAVREQAQRGPCTFTLLVPNATHGLHKIVDPEDQGSGEANAVIDHALPLLSEAVGAPVDGIVGAPDPARYPEGLRPPDGIDARTFRNQVSPPMRPSREIAGKSTPHRSTLKTA